MEGVCKSNLNLKQINEKAQDGSDISGGGERDYLASCMQITWFCEATRK